MFRHGGCGRALITPEIRGSGLRSGRQQPAVAPQFLQLVEGSRTQRKDVHHKVQIVQENPLASFVPLDMSGPDLLLVPQAVPDLVADRLSLSLVVPLADDEEVGEGRDLGDVTTRTSSPFFS